MIFTIWTWITLILQINWGLLLPRQMDKKTEVLVVNIFWGPSTLLGNTYVVYTCHMEMEGKEPIYHYAFCTRIFLANVDPKGHGAHWLNSITLQRGDLRAQMRLMILLKIKSIRCPSRWSKIFSWQSQPWSPDSNMIDTLLTHLLRIIWQQVAWNRV